ncbi:phage tail protein [Vallitalea guaymasensis]|uniref:phage tail protein n=1 Tax=Vallitalea guaymasensis TaxID=1185412 RepID=UPI000DE1E1AA|nr:phage tail protein [Vallitalea guaymasensis]
MAIIGSLGDIIFEVSHDTVRTFDDMKWNSGVKYTTHERHLKDSLIEFVGVLPDTITFNIKFSAFLGVNPIEEITKLLDAEREGKVLRLVIGCKAYGKYKWTIEKSSKDLERFDNKGNLVVAKVSISLKEYTRR